VVLDYEAISPVAHLEEPIGRGPVLERLLDYFGPVFDGHLPTDAYVWGPGGTGKSAVLTSLLTHMSRLLTSSSPIIHTSTRAEAPNTPEFVYVDARRADSAFGLYHAVLDEMVDESVPEQGVGEEAIRSRLVDHLQPHGRTAVVAVDHVNERTSLDLSAVNEAFAPVDGAVTLVTAGRTPPDEVEAADLPPERIETPPYERHALVDVLMERGSEGLAQGAYDHEQMRRLADWADGDASDALAALFGAADLADLAGNDRIRERDLTDGMNAVPRPSAPLGRVLTLADNRQLVLRRLVDLDESSTETVDDAVTAITDASNVDLSSSTVRRFLYELAEAGIVDRITVSEDSGAGRPPSRVEPRFPTLAFRRLYDLERG